MAYRLVAHVEGRPRRFPIVEGEYLLGSSPQCDIRIDQATVSRRHAVVRVADGAVSLEDLGSRNGIRVGSSKVARARLEVGARILIGSVPVRLEEVAADDLEAGLVLDHSGSEAASSGLGDTTSAAGPLEAFVTGRLPNLLQRLHEGVALGTMTQLIGEALFNTLPCSSVEVAPATSDGGVGLLFSARRESGTGGEVNEVAAYGGAMQVVVEFPSRRTAETARAVVNMAGQLLALANQRAPAVVRDPGAVPSPPRLPDPPSVVAQMRRIYADAARVARGGVSVLILGESGTGKELLARYVHEASQRAEGPFLGLNCASLPQDLLESELFGIEKGVATGVDERPGRFEQAGAGTLFLDEIGDMAAETQAKILRVLQSGEVYRLGGRQPRQVDVRVVAATNRDIHGMMSEGRFRGDLYHRIATWVVELPPLRDRRADIPNLAAHFLLREAARQGIRVAGISRAALELLQSFHWPGNVRQLENEMARAVLFLEDGELLDTSRLGHDLRQTRPRSAGLTLTERLEQVERDEIAQTLAAADGNVETAAERLGVSRATLYRRMRALGIESSR